MRLTKRLDDGQAVMDCEHCELKASQQCTALACRNRLKDRLAEYEDADSPWIPVSVQLPEDNPDLHRYVDYRMELMSVLVCGGPHGVTIANRMIVKPTGNAYLDAQVTDGWIWSRGHENVTHWMPLPKEADKKTDKVCCNNCQHGMPLQHSDYAVCKLDGDKYLKTFTCHLGIEKEPRNNLWEKEE